MKIFEVLVSEILKSGLAEVQEILPCSKEDVASFEDSVGNKLPVAYEEFLLRVGKGAGRFMQGTDIFFPRVCELQSEAVKLLEENQEKFKLSKDLFVFSMHQGYEFLYFKLSNGDNPSVYQFIEGNGAPEKVWGSFTEFMDEMLKQHIDNA